MNTKYEGMFKLARWSISVLFLLITALPALSSVSAYV